MWRWVIVLAGCSAPVCSLDDAVAELDHATTDCGYPLAQLPFDEAPFRTAHDCLAAGFAAQTSVIARWYAAGLDSYTASAWIGIPERGGYEVYEIIGGGMMVDERTTTRRCGSLLDLGVCASVTTELCLACENPTMTASCGD